MFNGVIPTKAHSKSVRIETVSPNSSRKIIFRVSIIPTQFRRERLPVTRVYETKRSNMQSALFLRGNNPSIEFIDLMISYVSLE